MIDVAALNAQLGEFATVAMAETGTYSLTLHQGTEAGRTYLNLSHVALVDGEIQLRWIISDGLELAREPAA